MKYLTTDEIQLNQIDADDPEVCYALNKFIKRVTFMLLQEQNLTSV